MDCWTSKHSVSSEKRFQTTKLYTPIDCALQDTIRIDMHHSNWFAELTSVSSKTAVQLGCACVQVSPHTELQTDKLLGCKILKPGFGVDSNDAGSLPEGIPQWAPVNTEMIQYFPVWLVTVANFLIFTIFRNQKKIRVQNSGAVSKEIRACTPIIMTCFWVVLAHVDLFWLTFWPFWPIFLEYGKNCEISVEWT